MSSRSFGRIAAVALVVSAALVGGLAGRRAFSQRDANAGTAAAQIESAYSEALSIISENYADNVDYEKANEAAIQGMLWTLDPHSNFFTPAEYRRLLQDQESRFSGIGVSILRHRDGVYVQTPVEGTPAALAGLRFGDRIVEVDGKDAREWSTQEVSKAVRGPDGERVTIKIERAGSQAPVIFTIVRGSVPQPSIRNAFMVRPGVGYIGLTGGFTQTTADELTEALSRLSREGMQQVVLDLRNNPGGLLSQAVRATSVFVPSGVVLATEGLHQDRRVYEVSGRASHPKIPLVVLVNRATASAAEIVAAALAEHRRAIVVGRRTYGKATVQSVYELNDGSALKMTTAIYLTPSNQNLTGHGVVPKVRAFDDPLTRRDEALRAAQRALLEQFKA